MLEEQEMFALLETALKETQKGQSVQSEFSPGLILLGENGVLDSLDTMIFLGAVDDLLSKRLGRPVEIVNNEIFAQDQTPFHSMQTLGDYIRELLAEQDEFFA